MFGPDLSPEDAITIPSLHMGGRTLMGVDEKVWDEDLKGSGKEVDAGARVQAAETPSSRVERGSLRNRPNEQLGEEEAGMASAADISERARLPSRLKSLSTTLAPQIQS